MKKNLVVLLQSTALASSVALFAQAAPPGRPASGVATSTAPSAIASTTISVRGTIDKYDATNRMLSLSTATGTVQFPLGSSTRIRQGLHKVDAAELQKLGGDHATVRYTESGGRKTVESVHVFGK